jgi:uncharacterized protein
VTGSAGRGAFVVPVAELQRRVGKRTEVDRSGVLDDLACSGSAVVPGADCRIEAVLESILGGVSVRGTVSAPWQGACRRCLAPARGTVRADVREFFMPEGDPEETYPLNDDRIDLEPLVHDAVLLELPVAPLCRDDCAGLCATCGADSNTTRCGCEPPADPRWAALDVLRVPDRGRSDG